MNITLLFEMTQSLNPDGVRIRLISIETVKLASSQHRFYFDVHKVCGKLGWGKTALGGW